MKRYLILASGAILAGALVWLGLGTPFPGGSGEKDDGGVLAACGAEYVEFRATDVARPGFPEGTRTPFDPSDPACKSAMATANAAPSPTPPPAVLLDEFGSYTLSDLGYSDITLHSWEPGVLGIIPGVAPKRFANVVVEYLLPEGATQGEDKWYVLHFHLEVEFADGVDGGNATVFASPNRWTVAMVDFMPRRDNGTLRVDSSGVDEAAQHGNRVEARFTNYFPNAGVVPGLNRLVFAVREEDGATVQTLRVFDDTAIEVTSVSPSELMRQRESERPEDYCDLQDPDCVAEIASNRENFLNNPEKYCDIQDPACRELARRVLAELNPRPTPLPLDPRAKEVLLADPAVQAMIGEGREGVDYWLRLTAKRAPWMGGPGARAELLFAEPVSYEGEVWSSSNPCAGRPSDDEYDDEVVVPAQPCYSEEPEYRMRHIAITNVNFILVRIDISPGAVLVSYSKYYEQDDFERYRAAIIEQPSAAP